ncbi:astacin-like metalloendopeptidase [Lacerta agilis]|uniref:astacin-like metalloendopeptidase n=1 Tax=Lacerta agilis TaxID=80427 RepID=UPI001419C26B|nr:astacin-like metalloendopeptidase [Lacerta agilis]
MNLLALSTLLLSFPRFTPGKPVQGIQGDKATGETYMHQDDIVYRRRTQRSAMKCNQRCVWPRSEDGLVNIPINVSTEFSVEERDVIAEAMQEFVTLTCIQFIRRSTEHDYINIFPADKCWSYFGKIGGKQQLGLAKNGCIYKGLIQHEINHALGFIHEQARNDRDKYVKIHLEYVTTGEQGNFEKVDSNNLGLPYDYGSVMHYGPYDFSSAPGKATIVPIPNASVPIGQRIGLSDLDVKKINKLYRCNCCSTVLRNRRGNFSSNNYPYSYPKNVTCLWLIQIPEGKVFLKFHVLDLQRSPNCASDYIRIYDGNNRNARLLVDKLCGAGQLPAVVSSGSMMLVEFVSDETTASKGFTASYAHVICGGTFTSTHGVVTSPNFPRKYPPNKKCLWIISAPAGSRISLTMGSFDLEEATGCNYDRLVFRDGSDISSPLLGTFCGKTEVPALNSTGSFLRIEFYSDVISQYSGFKLDYSIILPS